MRGAAAKALAHMGKAAAPFAADLAKLLTDADHQVRGSAAKALAQLRLAAASRSQCSQAVDRHFKPKLGSEGKPMAKEHRVRRAAATAFQ